MSYGTLSFPLLLTDIAGRISGLHASVLPYTLRPQRMVYHTDVEKASAQRGLERK